MGRAVIDIYVDADACPVKEEVYRVAGRYGLPVLLVANSPLRVPPDSGVEMIAVGAGLDAADDWIAEPSPATPAVSGSHILADRHDPRARRRSAPGTDPTSPWVRTRPHHPAQRLVR